MRVMWLVVYSVRDLRALFAGVGFGFRIDIPGMSAVLGWLCGHM